MRVVIDPHAKACPGVRRAIRMTEESLDAGETIYTIGELIHNGREVARLEKMGLRRVSREELDQLCSEGKGKGARFLIRSHGESVDVVEQVTASGFVPLDATCRIVKRSQELVQAHTKGRGQVVIAGKKKHAEVTGLMGCARGRGRVVSSPEEAEAVVPADNYLLIAQTTIGIELFEDVKKKLKKINNNLKVVDTTCKFLGRRRKEVLDLARNHDGVVLVGGIHSSNCRMLYETMKGVNRNIWKTEDPRSLKLSEGIETLAITGGASTPEWQLQDAKAFLEN